MFMHIRVYSVCTFLRFIVWLVAQALMILALRFKRQLCDVADACILVLETCIGSLRHAGQWHETTALLMLTIKHSRAAEQWHETTTSLNL